MLFFALSSSTWDGLSDGVAILIIAVLLLLGLLLGYALRGLVGRWQAESIEKKMRLRDEEAEAEDALARKIAAEKLRAQTENDPLPEAGRQEALQKRGNTVYDVVADFSTEGKDTVLKQFQKLILSDQN